MLIIEEEAEGHIQIMSNSYYKTKWETYQEAFTLLKTLHLTAYLR